jgi:hypothetical protein
MRITYTVLVPECGGVETIEMAGVYERKNDAS